MGRPGPQTQAKRERERAKQDKRRAKDERRAARKAAKDAEQSRVSAQTDDPSEASSESPPTARVSRIPSS